MQRKGEWEMGSEGEGGGGRGIPHECGGITSLVVVRHYADAKTLRNLNAGEEDVPQVLCVAVGPEESDGGGGVLEVSGADALARGCDQPAREASNGSAFRQQLLGVALQLRIGE